MTTLRQLLLDGSRGERIEPLSLCAGPLSLRFEDGGLRYIRYGEREVVRRVYCAVRDSNWGTVPDTITNLHTEILGDSFRIDFDVENRQAEIDFAWHGTIVGDARGRIVFEMDGHARSTFRRNRIGFCVLHPMEYAGVAVELRHANGSTERREFPRYIAAQNPFLDVVGLRHQVETGVDVELAFEGDVFETEDQRNWIDASFKTFCTPLSRPFPVEVRAGERIFQRVMIELQGHSQAVASVRTAEKAVTLELAREPIGPLPQIGFSLPAGADIGPTVLERLRPLKPAHLRCELRLSEDFASVLGAAALIAGALNTGLDVAVFAGAEADRQLRLLTDLVHRLKPNITRWSVFPERGWSTTRELASLAAKHLRPLDAKVRIGGGTPANFRELNVGRPPTDVLDFVTWSLTPQIHAFDNASVVENLAAHTATVESARAFAGGLPLVVGPIAFKMQVNPYATGPWPPPPTPDQLPPQVDPRQMSLFGAGWTVGSVKYLAESQVQAVTYYEVVGWKGLMESEAGSPLPEHFPSQPASVFPLYHVFADLAELSAAQVLPLRSSDPLRAEGLAVQSGSHTRVLVANLTGASQNVTLPVTHKSARIQMLDQRNVQAATIDPAAYRSAENPPQPIAGGCVTLELLPFAFARIDLT